MNSVPSIPNQEFFVYSLCDPRTNSVRYIGVTSQPELRYEHHVQDTGKSTTLNRKWLRELKEIGIKPIMTIIEECSRSEKCSRERFWIAYYLEQNAELNNHINTGHGAINYSDEEIAERRKLHASRAAKYWSSISDEEKTARFARFKKPESDKPKGWTPELRAKISAIRKAEWDALSPEERRARLANATKAASKIDQHGRTHTEAAKEKMRKYRESVTPEQMAERTKRRLETRRKNQERKN
jgi:hypothetical protein